MKLLYSRVAIVNSTERCQRSINEIFRLKMNLGFDLTAVKLGVR